MKQIKSWFNKIVQGALRQGVVVNGEVHKASPVKSKTGKGWYKGKCPKCSSPNGFVFRSHTDGKVYILFCQKCKKYSWSKVRPAEGKDIRNVDVPTNPMDAATKGMVQGADSLKEQCGAVKQDGTRCTYKAKANGFCGYHGGNEMPLY
jgi:hypothetical protein